MYDKHFLLDTNTVKEYVKEKLNFFDKDEPLFSEEIGDGNINFVFRIKSKKTGSSLIIKQADILLRSSGRPLDIGRNKIEHNILKIQGKFCPEYVPKIYFYDEKMAVIAMEDVGEYKNMRMELLAGKSFPLFADDITNFMVETLIYTTDMVGDNKTKKKRMALFVNPDLCEISEDLVFTEPYINYKNRNIVYTGMEDFVQEELYEDKSLLLEVAKLKYAFMTETQALIHGDLHSGSIFINEKGIKVIDPEFAFYGPIGYDVGNVIAHLILSYTYHYVNHTQVDEKFFSWIEKAINQILPVFLEKFDNRYTALVKEPAFKNPDFKNWFIQKIKKNSLATAGLEIIRRTVGDTKVKEIELTTDKVARIKMEKALIKLSKKMILGGTIVNITDELKNLLM